MKAPAEVGCALPAVEAVSPDRLNHDLRNSLAVAVANLAFLRRRLQAPPSSFSAHEVEELRLAVCEAIEGVARAAACLRAA
jgi:hypothetical protein